MRFLESKKFFILVVVLGLIGVVISYSFGLKSMPGGVDALWGNTPESIRPLYFLTTTLAFLGFSLVFIFLVFRTDLMNYYPFSRSTIVIMVASMLWLPYTVTMIEHPERFTWIKVRLVLLLVALGSWFIFRRLTRLLDENYGKWRIAAIAGSALFLFHTLVMDAILWPHLFR
jgi:hypothetical protein